MSKYENPEIKKDAEKLSLAERNTLELELMERAGCQTTEERDKWINENGRVASEIIKESEMIRLIREDRNKAIEEIEKRLYGK